MRGAKMANTAKLSTKSEIIYHVFRYIFNIYKNAKKNKSSIC
jgi:hypothetical protein